MPLSKQFETHRRAFYIVNLIFWIIGFGSLAVGVYFYVEQHTYAALAPPSFSAMSTAGLCVAIGCMTVIMSIVGFIGVSISKKSFLYLYLGFLLLLIVVQSATCVMGFLHDNLARERVKHSLYSTINRTYASESGHENSFKITWDNLQRGLKCCGVENYTNWHFAARWRNNRHVPDSCCDPSFFAANGSMKNCGRIEENSHQFFDKGCYELFADWLLHHLKIVKVFSIIFIIVEIALIVISVLIIRDINRRSQRKTPNYRMSLIDAKVSERRKSHRGTSEIFL